MRLWDGTEIIKPVVDRGLSEWSTMAEEQEQRLPQLVAKVEACLAAAPWGTGVEGDSFRVAHFSGSGPVELLAQCKQLAKQVTDAGDRVRTAIDNTLQTDAAIRDDLAAGMTYQV
ncbi:hypothetical protein FAF44_18040 [Nonomuraea sp. MG754425]|uniref:hypothetical protein n=1 Tax=Nonomuraea sp. MG754425 TaxID=2570319 RepID=UPI001F466032|nr:hypothetical protein [Nonomuraea sp. MG754425]MCF6470285.1 hypothetical protein [Nonomuraea sp. MG754425]